MGSVLSSASALVPTVTTAVSIYGDVQEQKRENAAAIAQQQYQQQQADLAYQRAVQEREWELQRRALDEQYRQQEYAQQQLKYQREYEFALQQQQYELEQRAYEERLREWEYNRLALEQQNQLAATMAAQDQQFLQAQQAVAQQQAEIRQSQSASEAERRDSLRRSLASQRAGFGARGIESTGGSGQVVLRGLIEDSETEGEQRRITDKLREQALTQDLDHLYQRNLLERTQLAEAQKFQLLTHLG